MHACKACALVCAGTIPANMNLTFLDAGAHPPTPAEYSGQKAAPACNARSINFIRVRQTMPVHVSVMQHQ